MNRRDLEKKLDPITSKLLKEQKYICFIEYRVLTNTLPRGAYKRGNH